MRLLLPIDGSQCAQRAVEYVIANRLRFDAGADLELHLANVQSPVTGDVSHFIGEAQLAAYHREESEKALASARRALDDAGLRYEVHTRPAIPRRNSSVSPSVWSAIRLSWAPTGAAYSRTFW